MLGNDEHWSYSRAFYDGLSPERGTLFHGCVFRSYAKVDRYDSQYVYARHPRGRWLNPE